MTVRIVLIAGHRYGARLARAMIEAAEAGDIHFIHAFLLHPRNMLRYGGYESPIAAVERAGVPLTLFDDVEELGAVKAMPDPAPQFVMVCGLRQLIPIDLLWRLARENGGTQVYSPKSGFIAFHPSDLPDGAGLAPVQWDIFEGQRSGAVSAFFIDDNRIDGGPVVGKKAFAIAPDADAGDLDLAVGDVVADLFQDLCPMLAKQDIRYNPQPHEGQRRVRPQLTRNDRWIDFNWSMARIELIVRAFAKPYGGAAALVEDRSALIYRVKLEPHALSGERPGTACRIGDDLVVRCGAGAVRLLEFEFLDR